MLLIFLTKQLSTLFSYSCLYGAEVSVLDSQPSGTYHKGRVLNSSPYKIDTCNMIATIGEKNVETFLFGERNNPHPSPLLLLFIQIWTVCCSLEVARKASKCWVEGWGTVSFIFPFFKLTRRQKGPYLDSGLEQERKYALAWILSSICFNSKKLSVPSRRMQAKEENQ